MATVSARSTVPARLRCLGPCDCSRTVCDIVCTACSTPAASPPCTATAAACRRLPAPNTLSPPCRCFQNGTPTRWADEVDEEHQQQEQQPPAAAAAAAADDSDDDGACPCCLTFLLLLPVALLLLVCWCTCIQCPVSRNLLGWVVTGDPELCRTLPRRGAFCLPPAASTCICGCSRHLKLHIATVAALQGRRRVSRSPAPGQPLALPPTRWQGRSRWVVGLQHQQAGSLPRLFQRDTCPRYHPLANRCLLRLCILPCKPLNHSIVCLLVSRRCPRSRQWTTPTCPSAPSG